MVGNSDEYADARPRRTRAGCVSSLSSPAYSDAVHVQQIPRRRVLGLAAAGVAAAVTSACDRGNRSGGTGGGTPRSGTASGTLESPLAPGGRADWVIQVPGSGTPKALLVSLHGKGGRALSSFQMGFGSLAARAGLAVVAVSGGDGYWHARDDGTDSGRLLLDEVVPMALERAGLREDARLGFIGWSMGGYGSLLLAGQLPRERVLGVAPMSTALWTSPGASAPGAFDDAEDYRAHDVFARERLLPGIPVSIACGTQDPFIDANRAYVARRPATHHVFDPGGHDGDYWREHAARLIPWLGSLA
jgi:S-formylglutathione hydrolase FrmB